MIFHPLNHVGVTTSIKASIALLLMAQAAPPATTATGWTLGERVDAATATRATLAVLIARDRSSRLLVKCDKGAEAVVSIQFHAAQGLSSASATGQFAAKPVALRFDDGPAMEFDWEFRRKAAFIADTPAVTALTVALAKARRVTVATTSEANFRFEATFDSAGAAAPIGRVLAACGYRLGEVPPLLPSLLPAK